MTQGNTEARYSCPKRSTESNRHYNGLTMPGDSSAFLNPLGFVCAQAVILRQLPPQDDSDSKALRA